MFTRQDLSEVVIVEWTDCAAVSGQSVQQIGGPNSLVVSLDVTGQDSPCSATIVLFVQKQQEAVNSSLAVDGLSGSSMLLNLSISDVAEDPPKSSSIISPKNQMEIQRASGQVSASEVIIDPVSISSDGNAGLIRAELPRSHEYLPQYVKTASYSISIVPLSDPDSMSLLSLSYSASSRPSAAATHASTGRSQSYQQQLLLCGLPSSLTAVLSSALSSHPSSSGSPSPMTSSPLMPSLLAAAIGGDLAAARKLQMLLSDQPSKLKLEIVQPTSPNSYGYLNLLAPSVAASENDTPSSQGGLSSSPPAVFTSLVFELLINPSYKPQCSMSGAAVLVDVPLLSHMLPHANLLAGESMFAI